jgi:ferredoxin
MSETVSVDWIRCDGHGLCAELFPERITLDDWGYPIIDPAPISPQLRGHAKRAIAQCPVLALRLQQMADQPAVTGGGARR